jgi:hypothetical protein
VTRLVVLWLAAIAAGALLLVATGYTSRDPDSALYAQLAAELATLPASRWIAPDWGGAWNHQGPFREHPVGIFILPVLLIRSGFPPHQAAFVVNMVYQAGVILLIPMVAAAFVKGFEARSLAWLLQLLPVAFAYRIRANQEHATLLCFLAVIYGTHRSREHHGWIVLTVVAFCFFVLIKGVFALIALAGAVLWLMVGADSPKEGDTPGSRRWPWVGLVTMAAAAVIMMMSYEALYRRTTGESFLAFYNATRLGGSIHVTDPGIVGHTLVNTVWYVSRLLWFAFPWSIAALGAIWIWLRSKANGAGGGSIDRAAERGMIWALLFTAVSIAIWSPAAVRAERFIFAAYYVIGALGAVAAIRRFAGMSQLVARLDRYAWLPTAVWFLTFVLNLASRELRKL